ncbi:hypothetical protein [Paraburkholderia sp. SIMBA_030]|uniref:hypothetical protein n=1 Tax=Paraburkholderia sp. SIMBA_030 TaxID=3085773 RepID=UPI00397D04E9
MTLAGLEPHKISDIPRYWAAATPDAVAIREDGAQLRFGRLWQNVGCAGSARYSSGSCAASA